MAHEYYDFLGIGRHATEDEIKRACKRKRRELTVDGDAGGLQLLNRLQGVLLDDLARKSYDDLQEFGDEVAALWEEAGEAMEAEDWPGAARLLKRALVLTPHHADARNRLGICLIRLEDYAGASRVYERLLAEQSRAARYWANAAYVFTAQAEVLPLACEDGTVTSDCPHCGAAHRLPPARAPRDFCCDSCGQPYRVPAETRNACLEQARVRYRQAITLEPYNSEHYRRIAETYVDEHRHEEAIAWVEQAICADGKVDFADFEHLFYLCRIHSLLNDATAMEQTAARIADLLPADSAEARAYAADRFGRFADELRKQHIFVPAARFFRCALVIDPANTSAQRLHVYCDAVALLETQWPTLSEDSSILEPMKRLAAVALREAYGHAIENRSGVMDDIAEQFRHFADADILAALARLKDRYRGAYLLQRTWYDDCERRVSGCVMPPANRRPPARHDGQLEIPLAPPPVLYDVVIRSYAREKRHAVRLVVSQLLGIPLGDAEQLLDDTPVIVMAGVPLGRAQEAQQRLRASFATTDIAPCATAG